MATDTIEDRVAGNSYVPEGLTFSRFYTQEGTNPLDQVKYSNRQSIIRNRDTNEILFQLDNVEAPESWSQLAVDIAAEKYFRDPERGVETSVRKMVERVVSAVYQAGVKGGYFATEKDGKVFRDELAHILINQKGSPNSPVWFNDGLAEQYGIKGEPSGNWAYDPEKDEIVQVADTYSRPQSSACFIQSVEDSFLNGEFSMMNLQTSEIRLFKQGSGTGTNFSPIRARGEKLSSGGVSSGLMSFLPGYNAWAGGTKSGGTTRRAAKMVILNHDHPEIFEFVDWKYMGERMARDLIRQGWPKDYEDIVYSNMPGQNSNNSVRVTDEFMKGIENPNVIFKTFNRVDGKVHGEYMVLDLWNAIVEAAWECGDPGLQFHTTINKWHTVPESGPINGSNPCSEYMHLDDSACNLASINLAKFERADGTFDVDGYRHAIDIMSTAQEILVGHSSYPTQKIARNSHEFRPIGLGYANLGALLMRMGIPYDSNEAETVTGGLTAILTGEAYLQSAKIAGTHIGTFKGFEKNREPFLKVMRMHREKVGEIKKSSDIYDYLIESAREVWNKTVELGEQNGYRNSQASVIAPTGTIGLQMDCDTTGIEPDFSPVKYKKLAGGGAFKIVNQSIPTALSRLGYEEKVVRGIVTHIAGHGIPEGAPHLKQEHYATVGGTDLESERGRPKALRELGYSKKEIKEIVNYIDGHKTIEGAPGLRDEHLPIFDNANKSGDGKRYIAPMGHIRVMAAAQPFISGAISKTINFPKDATKEEISNAYLEGWKKELKSIALYRDQSKWSQPLNTSRDAELNLEKEVMSLKWGQRKPLENRALGMRQKFKIGNRNYYVRTGEYPDGTLGEIFLDAHKGGVAWKAVLGLLSFAISKGMQYGMPLEEVVEDWTNIQAEPRGVVQGYSNIKMTSSLFDAVGRLLGVEYLGMKELTTEPDKVDESKLRYREIERQRKALEVLGKLEEGKIVKVDSENGNGNGSSNGRKMIDNDASGPPCGVCDGDTVKNGSCFVCTNCGATTGCS